MERPASDEAIEAYNRQLRERYGDAVLYATLNLDANPDDPTAHEAYLKAIEEMMEITPRHEDIIRKFGETLTAMTVQDPDGFWEEVNSPQYRPYPNKWC